jgi:hypothetical protein
MRTVRKGRGRARHPSSGPAASAAHLGSRAMIKVLYVEDNEDNVYMLKMRLELTDEFEVLVAEDGRRLHSDFAVAPRPLSVE